MQALGLSELVKQLNPLRFGKAALQERCAYFSSSDQRKDPGGPGFLGVAEGGRHFFLLCILQTISDLLAFRQSLYGRSLLTLQNCRRIQPTENSSSQCFRASIQRTGPSLRHWRAMPLLSDATFVLGTRACYFAFISERLKSAGGHMASAKRI